MSETHKFLQDIEVPNITTTGTISASSILIGGESVETLVTSVDGLSGGELIGELSVTGNISGSAFYGDGSNLTGIQSPLTDVDGLSGGELIGELSVTGNISGSAFFGDGSNLTGITDNFVTSVDGLSGGEIIGDVTLTNLEVVGDLTVDGTTTTINTQEVLVEDNILTLNSNLSSAPLSTLESGIQVNRGTETDYQFLFRESDETFVIGVSGDVQPVATREDTPTDGGVAIWNDTEKRFDSTITANISAGAFYGDGSNLSGVGSSFPLLAPDGLIGAPSYAFSSNPDAGLYSPGSDQINLNIAGTWAMMWNASEIRPYKRISAQHGGSTAPKYTFTNETNTGMFSTAPGNLGLSLDGTAQLQLSSTGVSLNAGTTVNEFSIDGTLAGDSDDAVPTEKAVKTYVDNLSLTTLILHVGSSATGNGSGSDDSNRKLSTNLYDLFTFDGTVIVYGQNMIVEVANACTIEFPSHLKHCKITINTNGFAVTLQGSNSSGTIQNDWVIDMSSEIVVIDTGAVTLNNANTLIRQGGIYNAQGATDTSTRELTVDFGGKVYTIGNLDVDEFNLDGAEVRVKGSIIIGNGASSIVENGSIVSGGANCDFDGLLARTNSLISCTSETGTDPSVATGAVFNKLF